MFVPPTDEQLPPAQSTAQAASAFAVLAVVMAAALVLALFLYRRRKGNRPEPQFTSLQGFLLQQRPRWAVCAGAAIELEKKGTFSRSRGGSHWGFISVTRACFHVSVTLQWGSVVSLKTPLGDTSPETGI